ncbi:MAG: VOC family protein [Pseudomonadota bacterium]|nr:VOC family protein [Pseudomonadota bacterium]
MARGLDHIVHAVRNLDAAADLYRRLGFTVGARNRHPWGTHNYIVQLPSFFIELLTIAEPEKLGGDGFSVLFGSFNRRFLERQEGLSMLILESADTEGDARAFREASIAASAVMRFEREGRRPDGTPVKVAFSLGFARDAGAPDIGFAVCQQHYPENFWNPAFQSHPNGATGIASVIIVAENPTDHHIFLSAFTGERELQSTSSGLRVATARGDIQVMDPSAYGNYFAVAPPDIGTGARLAALRFVTGDMAATTASLARGKVAFSSRLGRIIVGPEGAMGAAIVFEEPTGL